MTLDEIKTAIGEKIDAAWEHLKDEIDPDTARATAARLTAEVYEHVLEVEAHLLNHVLGNATPAAANPVPAAAPVAEPPTEPTTPVAGQTGMATNPPAAVDEQAPADTVDETAQATQ